MAGLTATAESVKSLDEKNRLLAFYKSLTHETIDTQSAAYEVRTVWYGMVWYSIVSNYQLYRVPFLEILSVAYDTIQRNAIHAIP